MGSDYLENFTTRFWARVKKTDSCWIWTGYVRKDGYGYVGMGKKQYVAHRVAYEITGHVIPEGMDLDHICHNRACVRPDHLRPATRKQNNENMSGAYKNSKSGVRGVSWQKGKWRVQVGHNKELHHVGYFTDLEEAKAAAIAKRNELFTHNDMDRAA